MTVTLGALSVGPVAARAVSAPGVSIRLHSIFPSTVNLSIEGSDILVAMTGPSGKFFPHAVALEHAVSFPELPLAAGDFGRVSAHGILIHGQRGRLVVTLDTACRTAARALPPITRRAAAWRACARWLDGFQSRASCHLRMSALLSEPGSAAEASSCGVCGDRVPAAFQLSTQELIRAARALVHATVGDAGGEAALSDAVSSLVGAGQGLTPSGDDFLSGFMAALRACGSPALASAVAGAIQKNLALTGDISASLLRCAVEGFWLDPLLDLACALAADNTRSALHSLESLCGLGHSSGADIASGLLLGVASLLKDCA